MFLCYCFIVIQHIVCRRLNTRNRMNCIRYNSIISDIYGYVIIIDWIRNKPLVRCFYIGFYFFPQSAVRYTHNITGHRYINSHTVRFFRGMILAGPPQTGTVTFTGYTNKIAVGLVFFPDKSAIPGRSFCFYRFSMVGHPKLKLRTRNHCRKDNKHSILFSNIGQGFAFVIDLIQNHIFGQVELQFCKIINSQSMKIHITGNLSIVYVNFNIEIIEGYIITNTRCRKFAK